jgi:hypothetical protein
MSATVIFVVSGPPQRSQHVRFHSNSNQIFTSRRTVASCQSRPNAPQQKATLFDHLVGAGEQCRGDGNAERACYNNDKGRAPMMDSNRRTILTTGAAVAATAAVPQVFAQQGGQGGMEYLHVFTAIGPRSEPVGSQPTNFRKDFPCFGKRFRHQPFPM